MFLVRGPRIPKKSKRALKMVQESIVTLLQINVKNPKHAMGNNADMTKIQKETKTNKKQIVLHSF